MPASRSVLAFTRFLSLRKEISPTSSGTAKERCTCTTAQCTQVRRCRCAGCDARCMNPVACWPRSDVDNCHCRTICDEQFPRIRHVEVRRLPLHDAAGTAVALTPWVLVFAFDAAFSTHLICNLETKKEQIPFQFTLGISISTRSRAKVRLLPLLCRRK